MQLCTKPRNTRHTFRKNSHEGSNKVTHTAHRTQNSPSYRPSMVTARLPIPIPSHQHRATSGSLGPIGPIQHKGGHALVWNFAIHAGAYSGLRFKLTKMYINTLCTEWVKIDVIEEAVERKKGCVERKKTVRNITNYANNIKTKAVWCRRIWTVLR